MWLDIARRTLAVIILKVTGIFVGGSAIGLEVFQALAMAAFAGVIDVAQELSRSYLADGKLDADELNKSFGKIADKTSSTDSSASNAPRK
jgi:hypothetical protein